MIFYEFVSLVSLPTLRWAWYIKVRVLVGSSADESVVRATLKDSNTGDIYGIREDTTSSKTVCLEFKENSDYLPWSTSLVEIDVQNKTCSVSKVSLTLGMYQITSTTHVFAFISTMQPSSKGIASGIYSSFGSSIIVARRRAKAKCECSHDMLSCTKPRPSLGVGVTITCQPTPVCQYGSWSKWNNVTECSVTCGGGIMTKERTRTYTGTCDGVTHQTETERCNNSSCPLVCTSLPETYIQVFPSGCTPKTYDVKKCSGKVCVPRNQKSDPGSLEGEVEYCYGPTEQSSITARCTNGRNVENIDAIVTKCCGCIICNKINDSTTSSFSKQDRSVTFYGRVFGVDDNKPLIFGEVSLGTAFKTFTGFTGNFHFKVPQGQTRIVVNVRSSRWFPQNLVATTKVFHIPADHIGEFYKDIPMMTKSKPVLVNSMDTSRLTVATVNTSASEPLVQILIPSNQFVNSKGEEFTGQVNTFYNFVDPRDLSAVDSIVGDLTYEDENGRTGPLQTSGMFRLGFESLNGDELKLSGSIDVAIKADFIDLTKDPPVQLYTFNETTGRWGNPTKLKRASSRQKRQARFPSTFLVGNAILNDSYWVNFDNEILNYCFINMRMYDSSDREIAWTPSTDLTVMGLGNRPGISGWESITTGGMTRDSYSGLKTTENCVLTICGANNFNAYLFAANENGPFSPSVALGGRTPEYAPVNSIPGFTVSVPGTTHNGPLHTSAPLGAPLANTNGPVYHTVESISRLDNPLACDSNEHINYCRFNCRTRVSSNPKCALCEQTDASGYVDGQRKCDFHGWWSLLRCQEATNRDPHYKFYKKEDTLIEYSECLTILQIEGISPSCQGMPSKSHLAWFPKAPEIYRAYYIKIKVMVKGRPSDESVVRATSRPSSSTNELYGIREDTTSNGTVCLEYKSSGDIFIYKAPNFVKSTATTLVEIDVQATACEIRVVAPVLQSTYRIPSEEHLLEFKPPLGSQHEGNDSGLYHADKKNMRDAKNLAKSMCECSDIKLASPKDCSPPLSTGHAIEVTCSKP
ncbi:unnamed protein product [Owenia fusiformis]|uniref:Uncharacterized protein n=1 Tax=Owenia fusiformis TaxID=6347 RepID=A0A8S4NJZ2_OWEFU|nr:unnamed protein product [Owenia fusiformis]